LTKWQALRMASSLLCFSLTSARGGEMGNARENSWGNAWKTFVCNATIFEPPLITHDAMPNCKRPSCLSILANITRKKRATSWRLCSTNTEARRVGTLSDTLHFVATLSRLLWVRRADRREHEKRAGNFDLPYDCVRVAAACGSHGHTTSTSTHSRRCTTAVPMLLVDGSRRVCGHPGRRPRHCICKKPMHGTIASVIARQIDDCD